MIAVLTTEQLSSVKKSYINILASFLEEEKIESRYLRCLLKWGFQLRMNPDDLNHINVDFSDVTFTEIDDRIEKLEAIYHLVYMIYLDKVVEDVELEVATIYAKRLGFKQEIVSELFKSIATAPYDEESHRNVRQEIEEFLKLNNSDK